MKILAMDVEGTLFEATFHIDGTEYPSTMWQPIARELGSAALEEEKETHEKWDRKEYDNYLDWVKATIEIHRKYNLKKDTFLKLVKAAEYNTGVEEFFNQLNRNEWIPVLISGGFQELIRRAQNELDIEYGCGACEYNFDQAGNLESYHIQATDFEGKVGYIYTLLDMLHLNKDTDWVYVGDGRNDAPIARKAPMAFGINPHPDLMAVDGLIEISSFMDLVPYLKSIEGQSSPAFSSKKSQAAQIPDTVDGVRKQLMCLKQKVYEMEQYATAHDGYCNSHHNKITEFPVTILDYENTPKHILADMLHGLSITLIGYEQDHPVRKRFSSTPNLQIFSGKKEDIDLDVLKKSDFLFIRKTPCSNDILQYILDYSLTIPYSLLSEDHEDLLGNALSNVLYRYIYK